MSTAPSPQRPLLPGDRAEIRIISHSTLFYWWPVWAVGFIMAAITGLSEFRVAFVPHNSFYAKANSAEVVPLDDPKTTKKVDGHYVVVMPEKAKFDPAPDDGRIRLHISANKNLGVIYAIWLLVVIVITNVPLRGLWSVVIIVVIVLLSVIFALAGVWERILNSIDLLNIHINMAGYLFISIVLLGIWLVTFLFFDKQVYMIFTPGQLRVCMEVGGGEIAYDTQGMVIQKQRDDLFRHWILGLGSGDLIVRTSGAHAHEFHLNNVLFIGHKLKQIEEMQRDRPVVGG
jgi:hypothetical protein